MIATALAGCGGCAGPSPKPPGDENLGNFRLHAVGSMKLCDLAFVGSFDQDLTLSRSSDGGGFFFVLDGQVFDGGFDGQVAQHSVTGLSAFNLADGGNCNQCKMTVTDSMALALLSKAQSSALADMCPDNPLDGGVPVIGADGGDIRPVMTDGGFDAVRVCGEIHDVVSGEGAGFFCDTACAMCRVTYRVTGERK